MKRIVSIVTASIYPNKIRDCFNNFQDTVHSKDSFEVLIKVDDNDKDMISFIKHEKDTRPFQIKYIVTPKLKGYWSLYKACNDLCKIADPETYFVCGFNDETQFETKHWDESLRKYVDLYPDKMYHLRTSLRKQNEYQSIVECLPYPESYGYFSKKWIELTEGIAVDEANLDTGQECINFFLRRYYNYNRGIPINGIKIANEELATSASHGLSPEKILHKKEQISYFYTKLLSLPWIQHFNRIAIKMKAYIEAFAKYSDRFYLHDNREHSSIEIKDPEKEKILETHSYKIDVYDWIMIICNTESILSRNKRVYDSWPPLLANQINARHLLVEQWINAKTEDLEILCNGKVGKAHKTLLNMYLRNKSLGIINQYKVDELAKSVAICREYVNESVFLNELLEGLFEKKSIQHSIAVSLYCGDGELDSQISPMPKMLKWMMEPLPKSY